jgi:hypothetical protein
MKNMLIAALLIAAATQPHAEAYKGVDSDCSDFFGLNVCAGSFESTTRHITYVEENQNKFTTKLDNHGPLFSTILTSEESNQIKRENSFKNSDSFRAYMKTLGSTDSANSDSEFSVTKRLLDDKNFGLDCRVITSTKYELSSSYSYDCAIQKYF